ncbi:MAG: D-alanyl-D-alanine carboxypeptidase [Rickettsiales bacterium]|nr:D-alanyl-D-alanine carboxypeptidase [Rickettsiales bacterium]
MSYIVMDGKTGQVLEQSKDKDLKYPASLTKIMTLYLTFEALERGDITMDTKIEISDRIANQPKFNAELKEGEFITVNDAILGIIVKSFNDFAVALSEVVDDNEWEFVRKMNQKARELNLENTYFKNSTGLSDVSQTTTAFDLAKLVFRIKKDFPEYYDLFSTKSFIFRDKLYETHNHVLMDYKYAQGLKTGFTRASGYNLATTAKKDDKDLIGIIISCTTLKDRDTFMISILDNNFNKNLDITASNLGNITKEENFN